MNMTEMGEETNIVQTFYFQIRISSNKSKLYMYISYN